MDKQNLIPGSMNDKPVEAIDKLRKTAPKTLTRKANSEVEPVGKTLNTALPEYGGVTYTNRVPDGFVLVCETRFDRGCGLIVQSFGKNVIVEISMKDSSAILYADGRKSVLFEKITTADWNSLLYGAQQIYNIL